MICLELVLIQHLTNNAENIVGTKDENAMKELTFRVPAYQVSMQYEVILMKNLTMIFFSNIDKGPSTLFNEEKSEWKLFLRRGDS